MLEEKKKVGFFYFKRQDEMILMKFQDVNINKLLDKDEQEEPEDEEEMNQEMGSQANFY